jgi:hypothetical protein
MPKELYDAWDSLDAVRHEYNQGFHSSKKLLQRAQWEFDKAKKALKHQEKVQNLKASKNPHAPIVAAVKDNSDLVSDSLMVLRDSLTEQMHEALEANTRAMTAMLGEIRELRRVSVFVG